MSVLIAVFVTVGGVFGFAAFTHTHPGWQSYDMFGQLLVPAWILGGMVAWTVGAVLLALAGRGVLALLDRDRPGPESQVPAHEVWPLEFEQFGPPYGQVWIGPEPLTVEEAFAEVVEEWLKREAS